MLKRLDVFSSSQLVPFNFLPRLRPDEIEQQMFLMLARKDFQKMVVVQLLQLKERYDRNYISCSDIHMPLFLHVFIACFFGKFLAI